MGVHTMNWTEDENNEDEKPVSLLVVILGGSAGACAIYHVAWFFEGFLRPDCAPGDFPWEDVFLLPVADLVYGVAKAYETFVAPIICG
jgi:hypothetical protein